jgi:alanyl-tRNA synthetase
MTGNEIRSKFLEYFGSKGHAIVADSSLVPQDDPTLLFTNAGMVQFKRLFMGEEKREYVRAATCQRCVRAGGKHNDLENVGHTARHHTFFEMLGNFSFGDYFKEDAINFAWDFLTNILELPKKKLWVSVFENDDEAYALWEKVEGLPDGRIVRLGEKDNFWAMGDTGPCGPCSEIHIDQGPEVGCGYPDCKVGCERDCDRFLELWNLVFMQFYRDESGTMTPLPRPSIDTGMGLERITAVVQGKFSNYDSDLFAGLIGKIGELAGKTYGQEAQTDTAMRVIADHCRAVSFLIADGVLPANEGRGYVLRRIMRRAIRFGRWLGLTDPFLAEMTRNVVEIMKDGYPHLREATGLLAKVTLNEEERFRETLDNGLGMLQAEIERLQAIDSERVAGDFIFKLYDTFGFPLDIVRDVAAEQGLSVDEAGFAAAMEEQRQRSKKSWKEGGVAVMVSGIRSLMAAGRQARFVGYETGSCTSTITGIVDGTGERVPDATAGDRVSIFCPETPFYAEAGGQVGDHGDITGPSGRARVRDTITVGDGIILHEAEITSGTLAEGDTVELNVAEGRRQRIACNHTATHILHAAMKQVLGDHVKQSGSLVTPERLRFDFTHFSPLTPGEMKEIELVANREVRANIPVETEYLDRESALQSGATALFGEKYGEKVRVVSLGNFSRELCGGIHVGRTGDIGMIKMVTESGIAAGIRRIEAITGEAALTSYQELAAEIEMLGGLLRSSVEELPHKIKKQLAREKELEKKVAQLTARLTTTNLDAMFESARVVHSVKVIAAQVELDSPKTLRDIGDKVRDKLDSGVAALGGVFQGKAALLVIVTKDLAVSLRAGDIVKKLSVIVGGSGGGRPDMAQAGGPLADKLPEALNALYDIVEESLAGHGKQKQ